MKHILKVGLYLTPILGLILAGCQPSLPRTAAQRAVVKAFDHFKKVVDRDDSIGTSQLLSRESLADYGRFRDLALYAPAAKVHAMTVGEKYFTLGLRQMSNAGAIKKMSNQDVFRFLMDKGMTMNKNLISKITLGKITVSGDTANAAVLINDKPVKQLNLLLLKESGQWKVDVRNLLKIGDEAIAKMVKEHHVTEDMIITQGLQALSKKRMSPNIWMPLAKQTH